ncbi:MAG: TldD/PmbA family protein [Alphaproteobacteria bacterium]|nr:TldD/PmbA family protein [Alphaproteobacteria bacterium]
MPENLNAKQASEFLIEKAIEFGADSAESIAANATQLDTSCRLGKLEEIEYTESSIVDLHALIGKRQSFISTNSFDTKNLTQLAKRAVDMAKILPEDPYCGLASKEMQIKEFKDFDTYDDTTISSEKALDISKELESYALENKAITNSEGAGFTSTKINKSIISSTGFQKEFFRSFFSAGLTVLAGTEEKQIGYDNTSAVYFTDLEDLRQIGINAADNAIKMLGAKKVKSCRADVIFDKKIASGIIGIISNAISGTSIVRGTSFLKDSLNKQVLKSYINLEEKPHIKRGCASRDCDSEGLPTKDKNIIENGILKTWLLNLKTARQLNLSSTGNGIRSAGSTTSCSPSNLFLTGGTKTPKELYSDIKYGFYITRLFGQGVDLITGNYSRGAAGFLIENGVLTKPVNEITIASNLKDMLLNLNIANDLDSRHQLNAPTIRIDNMTISGE